MFLAQSKEKVALWYKWRKHCTWTRNSDYSCKSKITLRPQINHLKITMTFNQSLLFAAAVPKFKFYNNPR